MSRTLLRALLAALVVVTLTATSANAETWRHQDPPGDAVAVGWEDGHETTTVDPTNESADITQVVVRHKAHVVLVDLILRDLRAEGASNTAVRLLTDRAEYLALVTQGADDQGSVELSRGRDFVSCALTWARFRPRQDRIRVRVGRNCLDRPGWVRATASYRRFDLPGASEPQGTFRDEVASWSPRLRPARPAPPPPLTLHGAYGWADRRPVGGTMTDAFAALEIGARRGVVIERVRAGFDGGGVRTIGKRFAPPDRGFGGAIVHQWPLTDEDGPTPTIPAGGAHLTPTGEDETWLLVIGYRVTEPGRHLRPTITIDYRVGDEHFTVTSRTPALICAGRKLRDQPCEPTDDELGRATLRSAPWTSTATPSSSS